MANKSFTLTSLKSEDIEGTQKMKVWALLKGLGRQDESIASLVSRLSFEAGVTSVAGRSTTSPSNERG